MMALLVVASTAAKIRDKSDKLSDRGRRSLLVMPSGSGVVRWPGRCRTNEKSLPKSQPLGH